MKLSIKVSSSNEVLVFIDGVSIMNMSISKYLNERYTDEADYFQFFINKMEKMLSGTKGSLTIKGSASNFPFGCDDIGLLEDIGFILSGNDFILNSALLNR